MKVLRRAIFLAEILLLLSLFWRGNPPPVLSLLALVLWFPLFFLVEKGEADPAKKARLLELCRHQRHDFLNHIQVISGWLQLGRPERALDYIKETRQTYDKERQFFLSQDDDLSLTILEARHKGAACGVRISITTNPDHLDGFLRTKALARMLRVLLDGLLAMAGPAGEEKAIDIRLQQKDGLPEVEVRTAGLDLTGEARRNWQRKAAVLGRGTRLIFAEDSDKSSTSVF
ncbi:MAG: Spo0B domain-containing protein [Firmicutes bacterium]|nr:Spo0B domain-containing protein [Bacillota bacterium]MCL5038607.1 Spo0B domain-containing protein [Bacillota bacterium]